MKASIIRLIAVLVFFITASSVQAAVYIHGAEQAEAKAVLLMPDVVITKACTDSGIVKFSVHNSGTGTAAAPFQVGLYADMSLEEQTKITTSIPAGGTLQGQFSKTVSGKVLKVCADSQDQLSESSEINNCMTVSGECAATAQADLEITNISIQKGKACFTMKNSGKAVVPKGVKVSLTEGQTEADTYTVKVELHPGDEVGECFSYDLADPDTNSLMVCADSESFVEESDENNNCMMYYPQQQDTQAPQISGVSVSGVGSDSATVTWTTDEAADSTVKYGTSAGVFDQESGETASVTSHSVTLSGLAPGTTYTFYAQSTDSSGNTGTSSTMFFTTTAGTAKAPSIKSMAPVRTATGKFPLHFKADIPDDVTPYKVEFSIGEKIIATDYAAPFDCWFNPYSLGLAPQDFAGTNTVVGTIFNADGSSNTFTLDWESRMDCMNTLSEVDILYVSPDEIYSENDPAMAHVIQVWVRAVETDWVDTHVDIPREPGFIRERPWVPEDMPPLPPRTGREMVMTENDIPADQLTFHFNDHSFSGTYEGEEPYMDHVRIFSFSSGDLDWGRHTLRVSAETSTGCTMSDSATIEVAEAQPDLNIYLDDVAAQDSSLRAKIKLQNRGSSPAILDHISLSFEHFQTFVTSTFATIRVIPSYDTATRKCYLDITFPEVTTVAAGETEEISIRGVPILYPETEFSDFEEFGSAIAYDYHNNDGDPMHEEADAGVTFICEVTCESTVEETVEECIRNSDYLAVTSPTNLYGLFESEDAGRVLCKTAELTALRSGVLGYFDGFVPSQTAWRYGDSSALGNIFGARGCEYVIGDVDADVIRINYTYGEESIEGALPIPVELHEGDRIEMGNVINEDSAGNDHWREEIVLVRGSGHGDLHGDVTVYSYDYTADSGTFSTFEVGTTFQNGFGIAVGNILGGSWVEDNDEIAIGLGEYGQIHIYDFKDGTALPEETIMSEFRTGDFLACGSIMGYFGTMEELLVGSVSNNRIYIYGHASTMDDFSVIGEFTCTLDSGDDLEVADVYGDDLCEIIIADKSEETVYIYGYNDATDTFEQVGALAFDFHDDYPVNIEAGDKLDRGKAQITHWLPNTLHQFHAGEIHAYHYTDGYDPTDGITLDGLISQGGAWEQMLHPDWDSQGYLLIVGENKVVPTAEHYEDIIFSSISDRVPGHVDNTDRYYASTTPGNHHLPNLAFGRILGSGVDRILTQLDTSIGIADGSLNFDTSTALLCSGHDSCPPDDCDSIDFQGVSETQQTLLTPHYDSVAELYHTTVADYNATQRNPDYIALNGHGSPTSWDGIGRDSFVDGWDLGTGHPIVVANSCSTADYADHYSLAEAFLGMGSSAYIGATETSISPWSGRLMENFTGRWTRMDAGTAMKEAKIHRWSTNTFAWDWAINRYTLAIHDLFGDPKLEPVRTRAARTQRADTTPPVITGPVDSFSLTIPDYSIQTQGSETFVTIPDGGMLVVEDQPQVPTYTAVVEFPAGYAVQDVTLTNKSSMTTLTDLELSEVSPGILGFYRKDSRSEGAGWLPEQDFVWDVVKNSDGSTTLTVTAYPLHYNKTEKEGRFYKDFTFGVDSIQTDVAIDSLFLNKAVHKVGDTVDFELYVLNSGDTAADLIIEPKIQTADGTTHGLPLKNLFGLKGLGSYAFSWDSTGAAQGTAMLLLNVYNTQNQLLDSTDREFILGLTKGKMTALTAGKQSFNAGDSVGFTTKFVNTGSRSLSGTIHLEVWDAAGKVISSYAGDYSDLPVGSEATLNQTWKSTENSGDCTVKAYASFNGRLSDTLTLDFPEQSYQGWWYDPDAAGSGLSLDVNGDVLFLAWYAYDEQGEAAWWVAWAQKGAGGTYTGELRQYTGWPLGQVWAVPDYKVIGSVTLAFGSPTQGTLSWDLTAGGSGSKSIKKYLAELVPGGSKDSRNIGGWYIDERYSGMGFFIEAFGETLYLGWYHYDEESEPRWWVLGGWNHIGEFSPSDTSFKSNFMEFSGGQTLGGTYTAPSQVPDGASGELYVSPDGSSIMLKWNDKTTFELTPYQITMP